MKLVRWYTEPDPLVEVFADDAIPGGVFSWPSQERAQRLPYAVISLCAGIHGVMAWPMAFSVDPEIEADIERTLAIVSDDEILRMVSSSGPADWKSSAQRRPSRKPRRR